MRRSDFAFDLPESLIAQHPVPQRSGSRLLALTGNAAEPVDLGFSDLPALLAPGDLLIFNDTRVIPARLLGHKRSGGKVEVLVERVLGDRDVLAHVRASKAPPIGSWLVFEQAVEAEVLGREGDLFKLRFVGERMVFEVLDAIGHVPLPPYIRREDERSDALRYQTVYARQPGAVAAPTAGLHFDAELLALLERRGVGQAFVTLHVGAGTFQPVRTDDLDAHVMHSEWLEVGADTVSAVIQAKQSGARIVAVGTTTVRSLETAASGGELKPYRGETQLFIRPGYRFRVVDALITNFHLPESTLLMLVCAFGGYHRVMAAYRHAVTKRYRFFSYGDAMFLTKQQERGSRN